MSHLPVLLSEAVDALAVKCGGRYVDGTFGRGGHTREIIRRGGRVLGIDRDESAIVEGMSFECDDFRMVRGRHGDIKEIAEDNAWKPVDGILLDLGVSSPQLDEAERGFSFLREGPLDMRMDRSCGESAADLINGKSEDDLTSMFRRYGEEPMARKLARVIVRQRGEKAFTTTTELAAVIEKTIGRRGGHHPATRVFQALRMVVNDELGELERALSGGMELLASGGRFAVITFESLSDRMVKQYFAAHVGRMHSLQQGGEEWEGELPRAKPITRKAIVAGKEEQELNPRSRSAKLRVIEKE